MNDLDLRRQILSRASALAAPAALSDADALRLLGQSYRLACTDEDASDEAARIVADADALVQSARAALERRPLSVPRPDLSAVEAWLDDPRGPVAPVLDAIDELGALRAGLAALGADGPLDADAAWLTGRIERASRRHPAALVELARQAAERSIAQGVVVEADDVLLALDGVLHRHLTGALTRTSPSLASSRGLQPLDRGRAEAIGQALAAALQRTSPLAVSPELLDLAAVMAPAGSVRGGGRDVTLHSAAPAHVDESIELMADVVVRASTDEIEVELLGAEAAPVLLVPLVGGEPRTPCPGRAGGHARHLVFTPCDEPGLEGYALIVGDRLAFLRR